MSSGINFRVIESESTFLHPRRGFSPVTVKFQVRFDPLTGRTGHFSHFGAVKAQPLPLDLYSTGEIKGFCPFCLENREGTTPKFASHIFSEERARRGEALLIPNLFPYDVYSGVVIMTDAHVVPLKGLTGTVLRDSLSLGIDFLKRIREIDGSLPYHVMSWNYMPPSGGGLVHPHQQYFATEFPGNRFMDELRSSRRYYERYGKNYWSELVREEERVQTRYIGAIGGSHWIASFVSLGMLGDVMCVFPDVFCIDDFGDRHVDELVSGLTRVFGYYENEGIGSFNATLFFAQEGQRSFSAHLRIIPRTFLNTRDYAPDINFFQSLLAEPISVVLPEDLCGALRRHFVG